MALLTRVPETDAKSCGPDTSVLVSSLRRDPQVTVARKPITGETTYKPKPSRGECRVIPV
ncbi:hypothetical protein, partial [Bradyrhizobium sp.]|uniref:hypothetical protein n=1 Tax=Bradyrhizobium sp. TaxID=376 RepID=UPI002734FBD3